MRLFPATLMMICLLSGGAVAAPRATVITSPQPITVEENRSTIFLAGSIEMGGAPDWQAQVIRELGDLDVVLLNPRRDDWNKAWKPERSDPNFRQQVEWELAALERADVIVMYLAPGTQSPISLLELGLYAQSRRLIVYCPDGFWRKGNVDVVADRYRITQVDSLEALVAAARARVRPMD